MKPLCIDLFCGLGGFSAGFLANGYRCIGFDIEAHDYGTGGYPGELVLRDVRSINGAALVAEFGMPACIVASPPCQAYSYMAMPWSRAKTKVKFYEENPEAVGLLNELFNECFRIQREAIAAAGHHIPMIVENVKGAERWVGRARWHFGSFYLWGDVPALMPMAFARKGTKPLPDRGWTQGCAVTLGLEKYNGRKNDDSRWDEKGNLASHNRLVSNQAHKVPGFRFDGSGRSFQTASVEGTKAISVGGSYAERKARGDVSCLNGSKSSARKAASARIAMIPYALSEWIARAYYPREKEASA